MATMNISLPDEMKKFVESQVGTGMYANASDYVRDLIRERARLRDALFDALEEGEASGLSDRSVEDIVAEGLERHR